MNTFTKDSCQKCNKTISDKERFFYVRKAMMRKSDIVDRYGYHEGKYQHYKSTVTYDPPRPSFFGGSNAREKHSFAICESCWDKMLEVPSVGHRDFWPQAEHM